MNSLPEKTAVALRHPSWCAAHGDCADVGEHRSRWHSINPHQRDELVALDLRLVRATVDGDPPFVELVATIDGNTHRFYLTGGQAVALRHTLGALAPNLR